MITKHELYNRDNCDGIKCNRCPFSYYDPVCGRRLCLKISKEEYEKESNMEEEEFTLKDITDSMHSGRKIKHKTWDKICYVHFKNGMWLADDGAFLNVVDFSYPEKWSYYEEPAKTEKRTFYQPYVRSNLDGNISSNWEWKPSKKDYCFDESKVTIVEWKTKEFNVSVEKD